MKYNINMKGEYTILFDSSCGYSKEEIEKFGFEFIPFYIYIDNKEYIDGVNIGKDKVINALQESKNIRTSMQSLGEIENIYDKALKNYNKLIVINLSSKLSGMNQACENIANQKKYKGKVEVLESKLITPWIRKLVKYISERKNDLSFDEMVKFIKEFNKNVFCTFYLTNLEPLVKSGRVSKQISKLVDLTKIYPTLVYEEGYISKNKVYKSRNSSKSLSKSVNYIKDYIEKENLNVDEYNIFIPTINGDNKEETFNKIKEKILSEIPNIKVIDWENNDNLQSVILVHLGYKVTGIGLIRNINS